MQATTSTDDAALTGVLDGRMEFSDADLFGFLDALGTNIDGGPAPCPALSAPAPTPYSAVTALVATDVPGCEPNFVGAPGGCEHGAIQDPSRNAMQAGTPHIRQDSGSGSNRQSGDLDDSTNSVLRKSSTSGDEKQDIPLKRPGFDRDKNRAAQRAFRLRKKEKEKAKEALLEQLSAKLEAVQLEKQRLQQQNRVLESALVARVRLAADLKSAQPPFTSNQQVVPGRLIIGASDWKNNVDWGREDALVLEHGVQLKLTYQMLTKMQVSDFVCTWKVMVNKMAASLCEAWKDPTGDAGRNVQLLVSESMSLLAFISRTSPRLMFMICSSRLEDAPSVQQRTASPSLWLSIMNNMRLSEVQKKQLLAARREFFTTWGALLQERMCLEGVMRDVETTMSEDTTAQYCQLMTVAKQLQTNVESMHRNKCLFFSKCWREILQPVQGGSLIVQAYPFPPDLLSVIARLAEEAREPPAQDIMRAAVQEAAAPSSHILVKLAG